MLKEYIVLGLALMVYSLLHYDTYQPGVFDTIAFICCLATVSRVILINFVELSKAVNRECRGITFGIFITFGAVGMIAS